MPATEPDPTEQTIPAVAQDTEQQQRAEDTEQRRRAEDQALRNYIALAPYAAPRPGTAARAHARAAKIGAISAVRAQREIAALWAPRSSTGQHADQQTARGDGDGR